MLRDGCVIVAEDRGRSLVGAATATLAHAPSKLFPRGRERLAAELGLTFPCGKLQSAAVAAEARRRGIGTLLVAARRGRASCEV